ncbi:MAG TPA: PilZ domain-containing protein [Candidatus Acidoferrales bacterium]|jgi:hypothetical protein|nr:PilZ domain-containing protein [Candidatus Acidoferrales bacterium]
MISFFTPMAHHESQPFKGKNRRTANRYTMRTPLQYRTSGSTPQSAWKRGHTLDISAGGILIDIPEAMPVGSRLELMMDWPGLYHCRPMVRLFLTASVTRTAAHTNGACIALRILNHRFVDVRPAAVRPPRCGTNPGGGVVARFSYNCHIIAAQAGYSGGTYEKFADCLAGLCGLRSGRRISTASPCH